MDFLKINALTQRGEPFLFISDFKGVKIELIPLKELHLHDIEYSMSESPIKNSLISDLTKHPLSFRKYQQKFNKVLEKIASGETYLLNLTQATKIETELTLKEIYDNSGAKYKLRYKNKFVCFSPEQFIEIKNNTINTYPMKGTIDASLEDAKEKILTDDKETAEHIMVVDLLRNDLSIVAKDVKVNKFRYVTKIEAGSKNLLQVSSHISGKLEENWHLRLGNILNAILPAGSISGTPKQSTLKIIDEVEEYERGFYSGVFGIYDGENFNSAVMIRFVEKVDKGYIYKSGGGITCQSRVKDEYYELLDKIYLS